MVGSESIRMDSIIVPNWDCGKQKLLVGELATIGPPPWHRAQFRVSCAWMASKLAPNRHKIYAPRKSPRIYFQNHRIYFGKVTLPAEVKFAYVKKGDLRPAMAGAKRNPFCLTVACRSGSAGRSGQRRCRPARLPACHGTWLLSIFCPEY